MASFVDFARITIQTAERLYKKESIPILAFRRGWELVGVDVSKKTKPLRQKKR